MFFSQANNLIIRITDNTKQSDPLQPTRNQSGTDGCETDLRSHVAFERRTVDKELLESTVDNRKRNLTCFILSAWTLLIILVKRPGSGHSLSIISDIGPSGTSKERTEPVSRCPQTRYHLMISDHPHTNHTVMLTSN